LRSQLRAALHLLKTLAELREAVTLRQHRAALHLAALECPHQPHAVAQMRVEQPERELQSITAE
jgi:hypothetical protein